MDIALLRFSIAEKTTVYWSQALPSAPPFLTAPAVLIQGIYEAHPEMARKILRERIYTSSPMSVGLRGMVKVCAKRINVDVPTNELRSILSSNLPAILPAILIEPLAAPKALAGLPEAAPMDQAKWLAQGVELNSEVPIYLRNRPVGAVLLSRMGEVLACGVNTNARNRSCHAEMNLLRQLHARTGKRVPADASLHVTLKPCRMCAGMIWDFCDDPRTLEVFYDQDDPGPHARHTAFD